MDLISIEDRDKLIESLCQLSDEQFEARAKKRLKELLTKPHEEIKNKLRGIVAHCQYAAWCSDFEIWAMYTILDSIGWSKQEEELFSKRIEDIGGMELPSEYL